MNNLDSGSEWQVKGATCSDKPARTEFGLTQEEIERAIRAGKLRYQLNSMHGNPWFRLLRRELEALVRHEHGDKYLEDLRRTAELTQINRELSRLKIRIAALEKRRAEISGVH